MPPAFVLLHSGRFHKTVAVYNSCFFVKSTLKFSILHLKLKLFCTGSKTFDRCGLIQTVQNLGKTWDVFIFTSSLFGWLQNLTGSQSNGPWRRFSAEPTFQTVFRAANDRWAKNNRGEKKIADGTARNIAASVSWQKAGPEARRVARLAWWPPTAAAPILVEELGPRRVGLASGARVFEAQRSKMLSSVTQTPQRAELRPELWVSVSLSGK